VTDNYVSPASLCDLTADSHRIDFFQLFVTKSLIDLFVGETNLYATQYIDTTRDLRIVVFAFESNLESIRPSDSISNRIFESNRPYIPRKP